MAYPNPCDKCQKERCGADGGCQYWRSWINWNWATFRGYIARKKNSKEKVTKWVYQHPDRAREYLKNGPCKECKMRENCDDPCSAYWEWWDARMDYFRKVMGS